MARDSKNINEGNDESLLRYRDSGFMFFIVTGLSVYTTGFDLMI